MKKPDDKSLFNPNRELVEALKVFGELVAENTRHVAAQTRWLRENAGAASKSDLEKAVNQSEERLMVVLLEIKKGTGQIMATQAEAAAELRAAKETILKIGLETDKLIQTVKDLEAAVGNQTNASPELLEALAEVKTQLGILDDKVPDGSGDGGQTPT